MTDRIKESGVGTHARIRSEHTLPRTHRAQSKTTMDLLGNMKIMYVYYDLLAHVLFGDTIAPLLRIIIDGSSENTSDVSHDPWLLRVKTRQDKTRN